jgi:WD40 repeat protein
VNPQPQVADRVPKSRRCFRWLVVAHVNPVKLYKQVMIRLLLKDKSCVTFGSVLVCVLLALTIRTDAQSARQGRVTTGVDDVVFAISFSPDGSTLAIARGASDPSQRYGRIELWDTKTGTLRHAIKGFDGPVRSISFSPDGQTLVSASSEYPAGKIQEKTRLWLTPTLGELKWWDAQTGELKHMLTFPREPSFSLRATYSPDGKNLALVESHYGNTFFLPSPTFDPLRQDNTAPLVRILRTMSPSEFDLKLIDAETGEAQLKLNTGRPGRAVFSPDGVLLAKENGKEIRVWNLQTGREERRLKGFKGEPNTIAFSPDGHSLAVAVTTYYNTSEGNMIKVIGNSEVQIFDVQTWKMALQLSNVGMVNSLAFDPGGKLLVIGGLIHEPDGAVPGMKLWDLQNQRTAIFHTGEEDFAKAVDLLAISRNGGLLAFRSGPDIVQVIDTQTWKVKYTFDANSNPDNQRPASRFLLSLNHVIALAFSGDGKTLSGEIEGNGIKLWDSRTGEVKKHIVSPEGAASMAAISAHGELIVEAGGDASLRLWNVTSESKRIFPRSGSESISAIAVSPDGQLVAIGSGQELTIASSQSGETLRTFPDHQTTINRLVFSNDNRILASADETGAIKLWDLANGQLKVTFSTGGKVTAVRFAPGDRTLATAGEDGTVSLWDLQTRAPVLQLKKHSGAVNAIAFSADGALMATGGDDRTVIIWDTASGKSRRTLKGHDLTVTSLAFSPDASLIACGSGNASVVLWDVQTGKPDRVLK